MITDLCTSFSCRASRDTSVRGRLTNIELLVYVLTLIGCAHPRQAAISYGYLPIAPDCSFFVALDEGYFRRNNVRVEPVRLQSSNQALEALVAGRVDALAVVALEAALALEASAPGEFRIVEMTAATSETSVHQIVVHTNSGVQALTDLRGKTVGAFPGSQTSVFVRLIFERSFGMGERVRIIRLRPDLQAQALLSGQVDALFCLEPICTQLEATGLVRPISVNPLYEYVVQPFPTGVGVVSNRLVAGNRNVAVAIEKALQQAHALIRSDRARARSVLPRYMPTSDRIASQVGLYDYWGTQDIDHDSVRRLIEVYAEHGVLERRVDTADLYFRSAL